MLLLEGIFKQQGKEKSKEHCSEHAALFDAATDVEWLRGAAAELRYSVYASVEELGHVKHHVLQSYRETCTISNCYTCMHNC